MRAPIVIAMLLLAAAAQAQRSWTLELCIQRAEERNLAMLNAGLDAGLAEQAREQAWWDLAPSLNGGATHGYNFGRVIDRYTNTFADQRVQTDNFYLSSTISLFEGLRKQAAIKRAELDAEAAAKGVEAARNNVRLEVVQAFLDALGLRERLAAAEAQVAATRGQVERSALLVEAGRIARADLLALESQLAQEEYTAADLANQRDQRLLALARAMQLTPQEYAAFVIEAPAISGLRIMEPTADPEQVLEAALRRNPAFAQAELQAGSAERSLAASKAARMPSLSLNGSLGTGYSGRNFRQVGDPVLGPPLLIGATAGGEYVYTPSYTYRTELTPFATQLDQNLNKSIGFTLNVPLFNNMRNRYAVDQARVQQLKSQNAVTGVRNDLQRNVLDAIVAQRAAYRQYKAAEKAVEAAELNARYADERFMQGAGTSIELAAAKATANRSTADLIAAKYRYLMAQKYLEILQGYPVTL
jgi:outer membrane protein